MTSSPQAAELSLQTRLADGSLAGQWTLDPAQSTVALASRSMWGVVPVKGSFGEVSGQVTITPAGEVTGTITVGAASVNTKNKKRDEHLRSADFFNSEVYPHIVFTAEQVTVSDDGAKVTGTLQVRDATRPLTFPATVAALGADSIVLDAQIGVDRSEFGLTWGPMRMSSMHNTMTLHAVLARS
jgi:polyisoprenoid-binding protein YceI